MANRSACGVVTPPAPLLPAGAIVLLLLAIGTFFGGGVDACDSDDMVLAVSATMDGDLNDETGDAIESVAIDGDLTD